MNLSVKFYNLIPSTAAYSTIDTSYFQGPFSVQMYFTHAHNTPYTVQYIPK